MNVVGFGALSPVELVVLAVLALLCLLVGWRMLARMRGTEKSDVSGLKLKRRPADTAL
jgi:hypothetical protein